MKLSHGGNLNQIAATYQIPISDWMDLSTGISPFGYPVCDIPAQVWRELPQINKSLIASAKRYYHAHSILPVAGSQAAIMTLPQLHQHCFGKNSRVWLPRQGYKEHEKAWRSAGYHICHYRELPVENQFLAHDILVVINPNNPTGELHHKKRLLRLQQKLDFLSGWLIVDEAFMDAVECSESLAVEADKSNLFVLRSTGKFFGLAGLRLGFLIAAEEHLHTIGNLLGPWSVNGPALYIAQQALSDTQWQTAQKQRHSIQAHKLRELLLKTFDKESVGTHLFQTIYLDNAPELFDKLCANGVYVRLTDEQDALRFGIPDNSELRRLSVAVNNL